MKSLHIVILGSIFDGLQAYGPFEDYEMAADWAERAQTEWHAVELETEERNTPDKLHLVYSGSPVNSNGTGGLTLTLFGSRENATQYSYGFRDSWNVIQPVKLPAAEDKEYSYRLRDINDSLLEAK